MRIGGRPRQIETDDIIAAGRGIGLRELSLNAVASRLGVSSAALYRHVANRWGLEQLVGESLLADLDLRDDPDHDAQTQLLSFGIQLFDFVVEHPGLASYVQTLFPRGESGRRLLARETAAIEARGYSTDAAIVLTSAVATQTIGHAAAEDAQRARSEGWDTQREEAIEGMRNVDRLYQAHHRLPQLSMPHYARLMLATTVRAIVDILPPGRDVGEVIAELEALVAAVESPADETPPFPTEAKDL
ncbi:MAG: TetR/AcrR family transcriptional regulator [Brevibacterium sp.]|uniref:TetR/AcrR family transcriptional regulator n=1 Tax=Brevibacterium aurantiacum TaxID=273384 RepID=UPI00196BAD31|nr:TetR/AcrR family transcriptional regulator [Brevibacterium aurantiacum]